MCNHKLRAITNPKAFHRYECLRCGKRLKQARGEVVARTPREADEYLTREREAVLQAHGLTSLGRVN